MAKKSKCCNYPLIKINVLIFFNKRKERLLGEISTTSDIQTIPL